MMSDSFTARLTLLTDKHCVLQLKQANLLLFALLDCSLVDKKYNSHMRITALAINKCTIYAHLVSINNKFDEHKNLNII